MRAVLDTSVIVSALRSRLGASSILLQMAQNQVFEAIVTPALFLEYEEVVYSEEQRAVHGLSDDVIEEFFRGLAAIMTPVRVYYRWRPQILDADDEMVLEAALNGLARRIVTHDVRHFQSAVSQFQLSAVTPAEYLKEVRK